MDSQIGTLLLVTDKEGGQPARAITAVTFRYCTKKKMLFGAQKKTKEKKETQRWGGQPCIILQLVTLKGWKICQRIFSGDDTTTCIKGHTTGPEGVRDRCTSILFA
jgi:hypothetical protein